MALAFGNVAKGSECRYIVGKSRHRAHTESQREESGESHAIPGVVVAGHPVQRGMDANLGSLDRVYEALAASR